MSSKPSRITASTIRALQTPKRRYHHFSMREGLWFLEVGYGWGFDNVVIVAPTWQECWKIYVESNGLQSMKREVH